MIASLGRYEILAELGRGAMGVVYRARDPLLERIVAVKTILLTPGAEDRAEYEARFLQEAKAAAGLNHPGIVTIHDIGRVGEVLYLAMEYVEGQELRDALLGGVRLPVSRAVEIAAQIADALGYAHAHGVVHRDVKPANVMLLRDGRAKLMDFGIARMRTSDVKTQTGVLLGSPKYMSPEQVQGRPADARSDLFALGVVLYECLAGAPPFSGDDVGTLMYRVAHAEPAPPSALNPAVSTMLDLVVARALAKDPAARYCAAEVMAADLRACLPTVRHGEASPAVAERTQPLSGAGPLDRTLPLRPPALPQALGVSRAFDSSAALERLAAPAGAAASPVRRRRRATYSRGERAAFVAGILALGAIGAAIALG